MLVPFLVTAVIILGVIVYYIYFLAPKFNPRTKAELFLQNNRIDEAIIEFRKVLENNPMDISVHAKLSDLYLNQGKIDLAVRHLERVVEINRFNSEVEK